MANINKIRLSGTTYNIEDENASKTVELTQAQYDALATKEPNTYYVITDATAADIANYYTKTETDTALATKANTATTYTKSEVDSALGAKQDALVSGTNIKTINNESILGEGNIEIQGGGATYAAGTNISIDTANTINCTLPIYSGTGDASIKMGYNVGIIQCTASGQGAIAHGQGTIASGGFSHSEGKETTASGSHSHAEGSNCRANGEYSHAEGYNVYAPNNYEHSQGLYNISSTGSTDADKTLFSVGNGNYKGCHNAFDIRQNGDLYFADTDNTTYPNRNQKPMVRLQDMYGALGGLKLVSLTQAQYDALSTKDASTIYFING